MTTGHPLFALGDDHVELRRLVRGLCDAKIAPFAADVDQTAEFPAHAYAALVASDLAAPHIPTEFGGAGADALATCLVIEEVARACASSSLIPPPTSSDRCPSSLPDRRN